ncbi:MAG: DUF1674 domain-containing protein [Rhizobiales bacterium]|nr:DUF1674 domain-containing protein [Hyphomicrobiales bacterium]
MADRKETDSAKAVVVKRTRQAAERALAEAQARRESAAKGAEPAREIGGADAPEPVRYGDWETKGRAIDF